MKSVFENPLVERYASREMAENFSSRKKFTTWRRLWIALAKAERRLGLPITNVQIREMERCVDRVNEAAARRYEKRLRHDVMAHIRAYGDQCPKAAPIIHLGATSAYVVDNADLVVMRDGLRILQRRLVNVMDVLARFALKHARTTTNAFTHFQTAQLTTVGKRAALWLNDLVMDFDDLESRIAGIRMLGVKGAVGTQASFLALFNGNESKVRRLDRAVAREMGFAEVYAVSGQTYARKLDALAMMTLASICQSAHKFSNDLRLLQHLGEVMEPFGKEQVGSSAMPYKRNPVKAERVASLARYVMVLQQNALMTAAAQWFERTLDDSAGKRIALPDAFLACDAVLMLYYEIVRGIDVNVDVIRANVAKTLPFIATENIMMEAVKRGGNRQELHERIRVHAMAAAEGVSRGKENDLFDRLDKDEAFVRVRGSLRRIARPEAFVGRAPSQTREFIRDEVRPRLRRAKHLIGMKIESRV